MMCKEGRDAMFAMGYKLIKSNDACGIWCFENKRYFEDGECEKMNFELDYPHVISDTLTF